MYAQSGLLYRLYNVPRGGTAGGAGAAPAPNA